MTGLPSTRETIWSVTCEECRDRGTKSSSVLGFWMCFTISCSPKIHKWKVSVKSNQGVFASFLLLMLPSSRPVAKAGYNVETSSLYRHVLAVNTCSCGRKLEYLEQTTVSILRTWEQGVSRAFTYCATILLWVNGTIIDQHCQNTKQSWGCLPLHKLDVHRHEIHIKFLM